MRFPVGISDFKTLVTGNDDHIPYLYVDKSLFIKDILEDGAQVILITRPRRFGKTLNMSMLYYFFSLLTEQNSPEHLFSKLKILEEENLCASYLGKYPVIFISFKDIKQNNFDDAFAKLQNLMREAYAEHREALQSDKLYQDEKKIIDLILNRQAPRALLEDSLKMLSNFLFRYYQVKPIILIDEYDTPIHEGYINGYYDEMMAFMRSFLGAGLKDNRYLKKAVITGILRVSKESLFSDLNNVSVNTTLDFAYSDYFGFTEDETLNLLKQANLEQKFEAVKEWYNGYQMGNQVIYNPWSIIKCISGHGALECYWINTSGNKLIKKLMVRSPLNTKWAFDQLLQDKPIEQSICVNMNFSSLETSDPGIWTLLLMAGYLKAETIKSLGDHILCQLQIPNREVKLLFEGYIREWLTGSDAVIPEDNFYQDLLKCDLENFEKRLRVTLSQVISCYDVTENYQEAFYQGFMLGRINLNAKTHYMKSNYESGYGRFDIAIFPKDPKQMGIILELKAVPHSEKTKTLTSRLNKAANEALLQIQRNNYIASFEQLGISRLLKVGIAFSGKQLAIADNVKEIR